LAARHVGGVEAAIGHRCQQKELCSVDFKRVVDRPRNSCRSLNAPPIDSQASHLANDAEDKGVSRQKTPRAPPASHFYALARDPLFDLRDRQARQLSYFCDSKCIHLPDPLLTICRILTSCQDVRRLRADVAQRAKAQVKCSGGKLIRSLN